MKMLLSGANSGGLPQAKLNYPLLSPCYRLTREASNYAVYGVCCWNVSKLRALSCRRVYLILSLTYLASFCKLGLNPIEKSTTSVSYTSFCQARWQKESWIRSPLQFLKDWEQGCHCRGYFIILDVVTWFHLKALKLFERENYRLKTCHSQQRASFQRKKFQPPTEEIQHLSRS